MTFSGGEQPRGALSQLPLKNSSLHLSSHGAQCGAPGRLDQHISHLGMLFRPLTDREVGLCVGGEQGWGVFASLCPGAGLRGWGSWFHHPQLWDLTGM